MAFFLLFGIYLLKLILRMVKRDAILALHFTKKALWQYASCLARSFSLFLPVSYKKQLVFNSFLYALKFFDVLLGFIKYVFEQNCNFAFICTHIRV